jgi:exodeoxyribonuclease VII small subunit
VNDNPSPKEELTALNYEEALHRLEEILEKMNSGKVSLDESLKLYEEADLLIRRCSQKLTEAEQKIEVLIKNRSGELAFGSGNKPLTQEFSSEASFLSSSDNNSERRPNG